jgi:hypothetical protein
VHQPASGFVDGDGVFVLPKDAQGWGRVHGCACFLCTAWQANGGAAWARCA